MEITDFIQDAAGQSAEVIWGYAIDESLSEDVCVTVIATGFEAHEITTTSEPVAPKKIIHELGDEAKEVTKAVETPVKIDKHEVETEEQPQADLFSDSETRIELVQETQEDRFEDELVEKDTEEKIIHNLDDATTETVAPEGSEEITATSAADTTSLEENKQKAREDFLERQSQVKRTLNDVKMKLRLPGRIADLENEPAFKRRNVSLDDVNHSSESSVSHFSINEKVEENGERKIELRDDNPFLHDNVD